ncbi:MAG TPA: aminotransferase class V-fold PLP-dependent enzyme [Thermoanaerobaculia bacterium]|nr:aminotransferase class V-fold PLP-dependent enzyme [Thermoanaerobaculia bacterium]
MNKSELRNQQFPVTRNFVYLNHAAVGPLSTSAYNAMEAHARDQRESGAANWKAWYAEHDALRVSLASLLGANPGEISILKNTSEGLSFVASGLRWKEGDNVVTTDLEFPSNFTPWKRLESRGVECRIVRSHDGSYDADDVAALIDGRTRLLTVSSVAFHNGFTPDLVALGELCRARNVLFCVDAIQSLGVLPLDVRACNISFLAADGHKWLLGPEGTAVFFCAEEVRDQLEVMEIGWTNVDRRGKFLDSTTDLLPDGRRFEAGSLNTNGIYGLRASIDLIRELGVEEIRDEVVRLAVRLGEGLESIGFEVKTPKPFRSGIVAATPRSVDFDRISCRMNEPLDARADGPLVVARLHRFLEQGRVICAPREGMLRFSPHCYNSGEEMDLVVNILQPMLK